MSGDLLGSLFAAFGLAGAAGLNPWLPLFASALLARIDVVELDAPFDDLSSTTSLATLAALMLGDFVGDKIPGVDHLLHALGGVVAPASGAVLFTGQSGTETDLPVLVAVAAGAATAGAIHAGRATLRPASTVGTAGLGNPVLSFAEDLGSLALVVFAFALPLVALLLVLALVLSLVSAWRRVGRRRGRGRATPS